MSGSQPQTIGMIAFHELTHGACSDMLSFFVPSALHTSKTRDLFLCQKVGLLEHQTMAPLP